MSRLIRLVVILGVGGLSACGDGNAILSPPSPGMKIVAGNNQSGTVDRPLPDPLSIALTSPSGAGVAGVTVAWTVTMGAGKLSASSALTSPVDQLIDTTDGQGRASVSWTLGRAPGVQSVAATVTGLASSPANFSAIATAPIVLHYDGTRWNTALEDINGAGISLASIWGATPSYVFTVGKYPCGGGIILFFDGTGWGQLPSWCVGTFAQNEFTSVWGSSASDVFAAYRNDFALLFGGNISHYDGQQWSRVYTAPCPLGAGCPAYQAVWSSSVADAFAVGDGGIIAHYDGTNWNPQASGTTGKLSGVWGVGPVGAVFAVGDAGTILSYDRSTWRGQTSGTSQPLYAVWGASATDVFAVGGGGIILHYDGTAWTAQNSGTTQSLYGIWGTSGNAVFAVGDASTILHYDGTTWAAQTTAASINLRGIWGSSPTNVLAVGAPR